MGSQGIMRIISVKLFLIWTSGSEDMLFTAILYLRQLFVGWKGTICAILVEGMMWHFSVKLF